MGARYLVVFCVGLGLARPAAQAAPPDPAVQKLIDSATRQLEAGQPAQALASYEEAFRRSDERQLLYAIGVCHRQLGHRAEALAAFRAFLETDAPAEPKRLAQAAVDDLTREPGTPRAGEPAPPLVAPVAPPSPAAQPVQVAAVPARKSYSPWTWVTLGTGVALVVGGAVAFGLGEADLRKVADTAGYGSAEPTQMTRTRALELQENGTTKKNTGYALWALGGAALGTSIALFVAEALSAPKETPLVGLAPLPGGSVFSLQGRF